MATKKRRRKKKQKRNWKPIITVVIAIYAVALVVHVVSNFKIEDGTTGNETVKIEKDYPKDTYRKSQKDPKKELQKQFEKKYNTDFFGEARNDVTGKWRVSICATSELQEAVAAEYYKAFFNSDDEIHALVNFNYNTTAKITKNDDNSLTVTYYDYYKGEEHDAKLLFGGTYLEAVNVPLD